MSPGVTTAAVSTGTPRTSETASLAWAVENWANMTASQSFKIGAASANNRL